MGLGWGTQRPRRPRSKWSNAARTSACGCRPDAGWPGKRGAHRALTVRFRRSATSAAFPPIPRVTPRHCRARTLAGGNGAQPEALQHEAARRGGIAARGARQARAGRLGVRATPEGQQPATRGKGNQLCHWNCSRGWRRHEVARGGGRFRHGLEAGGGRRQRWPEHSGQGGGGGPCGFGRRGR